MIRASFEDKPYRRALMETYGARCVASPSNETVVGRAMLAKKPDHRGSLGLAMSEAVEVARRRDDTGYALGSVLNHVVLHQTVVGIEAMAQMEMAGDYPDIVIGCTGGGANFAGIAFPFIGAQLRGGPKTRIIAVEPAACPSLSRGKYAYDFGDAGHLLPLVKMHTLGSNFVPPGFHSAGLRYHGMAPLVSHVDGTRPHRGAGLPAVAGSSRPASSSRGPKASFRRPRPTTRSAARSTRRSAAGPRASRR